MSALPQAKSWREVAVVHRIAALRAQHCDDLIAALLQEAADSQAVVAALGRALHLDVVRVSDLSAWQARFDKLPFAECARSRCCLSFDPATGVEHFVQTDPFDTDQMAWARTRFGAISVALASPETFDAWLAQAESGMTALSTLGVGEASLASGPSMLVAEDLNLRQIGFDDSPAVRFVNSTLYDALKTGASDVHLESDPTGLGVKFRIDGVLTAIRRIDNTELAAQAISRIKVMAQLDIAERRVPQDGRLQVGYQRRSIDVRVSIMPSIHGEDAVLRILDREHLAQSLAGLTLAKLGFDEPTQVAIRMPWGLTHSLRFCHNTYRSSSCRNAGRGPTKLMSPLSTLHNCGSSFRLYLRSHRPSGVIRGSAFSLKTGPFISLRAASSPSFSSASATIVVNLYPVNGRPLRPITRQG